MPPKHTFRGIVDNVVALEERIGLLEATPPGSGGISYNFTQALSSTTWTIPHGLTYKPVITLYGVAGKIIEGEVNSNVLGVTTVTFTVPVSGFATLV